MRVLPVIFLLILTGSLFLLEWSVAQHLSTIVQTLLGEGINAFFKIFYWIVAAGLPVALLVNGMSRGMHNRTTSRLASVFISLFFTKLFFLASIFMGNLFEWVGVYFSEYFIQEKSDWDLIKISSATGFSFLILSAFIYGITKGKYRYTVHQKTLYFDDLPEAFDGFTITQISDIHSGSFHNKKAVEKGVQLINELQSDLFVFTGDLVNNQATEIEPWINVFKKIKAPYGKYSILGNHDYGDYIRWPSEQLKSDNLKRLLENHAAIGFRLLLDEHVAIEKDGKAIALLGVENWGIGFGKRGNLAKALHGVPSSAFKVLLSHDPSHWEHEVKQHYQNIHLTFSGHTHGMQLGIELFGWKWSPSKFRYPKWAGLYEENGRYLYVNRGFGFLGFAGRVGIWPEITVITLKKK